MSALLLIAVIVIPLGLDLYLPVPEENPLTAPKVALGRRLFRDPILSRDGTIACVACHDPARAFTDGNLVAIGINGQRGVRNTPTLINRAYGHSQFWDGRAKTLEVQVLEPIANPAELGLSVLEVVTRLGRTTAYRKQFQSAFRGSVDAERLSQALASYVRTIVAGNSRFDKYVKGDRRALTAEEVRGLVIFRGQGRCSTCHSGPTFSDERFHNTGVAWRDREWTDVGRFAVTGESGDRGAFKTPTLREVSRTAPYMHDGSFLTLNDVVDYYDRGGNHAPALDQDVRPLGLTQGDKAALLAFLRSLSGEIREGAHSKE